MDGQRGNDPESIPRELHKRTDFYRCKGEFGRIDVKQTKVMKKLYKDNTAKMDACGQKIWDRDLCRRTP